MRNGSGFVSTQLRSGGGGGGGGEGERGDTWAQDSHFSAVGPTQIGQYFISHTAQPAESVKSMLKSCSETCFVRVFVFEERERDAYRCRQNLSTNSLFPSRKH